MMCDDDERRAVSASRPARRTHAACPGMRNGSDFSRIPKTKQSLALFSVGLCKGGHAWTRFWLQCSGWLIPVSRPQQPCDRNDHFAWNKPIYIRALVRGTFLSLAIALTHRMPGK